MSSNPRPPNPDELFDVVDENDRVVGRAPRWEVHARGWRHRAVHVLVHNDAGRIFLQQRSLAKDSFPGCWDSSCSGHLDTGEDYLTAARRELGEELGFHDASAPLRPVVKLPACAETTQEFIEVFLLGPTSGPFTLHPDEISAGRWVKPADLTAEISAKPEQFASAIRFLWTRHRDVILAGLGQPA